jgi:hypothetical protein
MGVSFLYSFPSSTLDLLLFICTPVEISHFESLNSIMARTISLEIALIALITLVLYFLKTVLFDRKGTRVPLPPGPKGLPVLGNIHDLPSPGIPEYQHWLEHKDLYGPISSVTVLGQTMIIIHDKTAALELLDKRSRIHSGRPRMKFAFEM